MIGPKKAKIPTEAQSRVLRRLAQNGGSLILTHADDGDRYSDMAGITVAAPPASALIANGWVIANRDSMYDLAPQSWSVRKL